MIRRLVASLVAPVLLVGTLTGCSTFTDADAVARANGDELSDDLFDDLLTVLGGQADLPPPSTGVLADAARNVISQWLQVSIVEQHLDEIGIEVTDEARTEAEATIDGDPTLGEITDGARSYLIRAQAAIATFNQLPDPQASFEEAIEGVDVHVSSRYGYFDEQFGILPLGLGLTPGGI